MEDTDDVLDGVEIVTPMMMQLPAGYVAITTDEYADLCDNAQRVSILVERIEAGERLTTEMLLRALGAFDLATAEAIERKMRKNT